MPGFCTSVIPVLVGFFSPYVSLELPLLQVVAADSFHSAPLRRAHLHLPYAGGSRRPLVATAQVFSGPSKSSSLRLFSQHFSFLKTSTCVSGWLPAFHCSSQRRNPRLQEFLLLIIFFLQRECIRTPASHTCGHICFLFQAMMTEVNMLTSSSNNPFLSYLSHIKITLSLQQGKNRTEA